MKKTLINVLLFTAGAAIGSLVTWKVVKTKYERIAQEEIDSVKEAWARRAQQETKDKEDSDVDCDEYEPDDEDDCEGYEFDEGDMFEYSQLAFMYNKSGDDTENDEEGEGDEEVPYINGPYIITPNDFGDGNYDHELRALTYYDDGILADDWYQKFDIDDTIGEENIEHFGDYAEDVLHIRNERLRADYEIVRDPRTYAEAAAINPQMDAYENRGSY